MPTRKQKRKTRKTPKQRKHTSKKIYKKTTNFVLQGVLRIDHSVSVMQETLDGYKRQLAGYQRQLGSYKRQYEKIHAGLEGFVSEYTRDRSAQTQKLNGLGDSVSGIEQGVSELQSGYRHLNAELQQMRAQCEDFRNEYRQDKELCRESQEKFREHLTVIEQAVTAFHAQYSQFHIDFNVRMAAMEVILIDIQENTSCPPKRPNDDETNRKKSWLSFLGGVGAGLATAGAAAALYRLADFAKVEYSTLRSKGWDTASAAAAYLAGNAAVGGFTGAVTGGVFGVLTAPLSQYSKNERVSLEDAVKTGAACAIGGAAGGMLGMEFFLASGAVAGSVLGTAGAWLYAKYREVF